MVTYSTIGVYWGYNPLILTSKQGPPRKQRPSLNSSTGGGIPNAAASPIGGGSPGGGRRHGIPKPPRWWRGVTGGTLRIPREDLGTLGKIGGTLGKD